MRLKVHIRWMIRHDMPEVLAIESECFDHPWTEDDFIKVLRQRNAIGMVAEQPGGAIVGYMIYELHKRKLHVLSFAVHPARQMKGVGRQMIDKLRGKLVEGLRERITLDIRETNLDGQLFFRACGFEAVEVLREFESTGEDAYRMVYRLKPGERAISTDSDLGRRLSRLLD